MEIYLVFVDTIRNSNKFWAAIVEDSNLTVQWGRVGYQAQTKVHTLANHQRAVSKFNNLVAEKKGKGYRESQPEIDTSDVYEIERAIGLLNAIRSYVVHRNFDQHYIQLLNQYLKIVPTPLGMQIAPYAIYLLATFINELPQSFFNSSFSSFVVVFLSLKIKTMSEYGENNC